MREFFFVGLALLALALVACGDDDDDDAEPASEETDEDTDGSSDATAEGDPADLVGRWEGVNLQTFRIQDDETWSLAGPGGDELRGTYTATPTEITLVVEDEEPECTEEAVYAWTIEDDVLTFNVVDNSGCPILSGWITDGEPLTRVTS